MESLSGVLTGAPFAGFGAATGLPAVSGSDVPLS